jgi:hypothetical protein
VTTTFVAAALTRIRPQGKKHISLQSLEEREKERGSDWALHKVSFQVKDPACIEDESDQCY